MNKTTKSSEELVSMFLGLVIVLVIVGLIFSYFQRRRGSISLPGVSNQNKNTIESEQKKMEEENGIYTVKKGDNLWKIAQEQTGSGYNWTMLAKENNLKNVGQLEVGQKIKISKAEIKTEVVQNKPSATITGETYTVVKGDNLWKIAVRKYMDGYKWTEIWQVNKNKLNDPGKLEIGMVLNLPSLK